MQNLVHGRVSPHSSSCCRPAPAESFVSLHGTLILLIYSSLNAECRLKDGEHISEPFVYLYFIIFFDLRDDHINKLHIILKCIEFYE